MVVINYLGRLGNQMCQYAIGRVIAEKKGHRLGFNNETLLRNYFPNAIPIDGVVDTSNHLIMGTVGAPPHNLCQYLDWETALNHKGLLLLHGYFQKHYYYTPYLPEIQKWFTYDDSSHEKPDEGDVVVHVRLGDDLEHGYYLPMKVRLDILAKMEYNRCIIVTDSPNEPILNEFAHLKNVFISQGTMMEDFTWMKYAKRIILSQSSFSWWASFLGNQTEVYVPLNTKDVRWWKYAPQQDDIDFIPDNSKYIKIKL
jgi:hypothetical protein